MNGSHSPMPFEVTQPSLEVNNFLSMKAEKTYVLYFGKLYLNIPLIMAIQHPEPYLPTRLWAFFMNSYVCCVIWSTLSSSTSSFMDTARPDPSGSWILNQQLDNLLRDRQGAPCSSHPVVSFPTTQAKQTNKTTYGEGATLRQTDGWGCSPFRFSPLSDLGWI